MRPFPTVSGQSSPRTSFRSPPGVSPCQQRRPSNRLTYHPAPTPPRRRTWAPVVANGRLERHAESADLHSPAARPGTRPTRDLGRAVSGHEAALVHLTPLRAAGREGTRGRRQAKDPRQPTAAGDDRGRGRGHEPRATRGERPRGTATAPTHPEARRDGERDARLGAGRREGRTVWGGTALGRPGGAEWRLRSPTWRR